MKTTNIKKFSLLLVILIFSLSVAGCGSESASKSINWPASDVTADNIKAALSEKPSIDPIEKDSKFPNDITQVTVNDVPSTGQKNVSIYFKPPSVWDETYLIKEVGGTTIVAGSVMFSNPKINEITMYAQADMTDQYGKTKTNDVVIILLSRATAEKIDWKGLADRHVSDPGNIYRIADRYNIQRAVLNNVNKDEIRLK